MNNHISTNKIDFSYTCEVCKGTFSSVHFCVGPREGYGLIVNTDIEKQKQQPGNLSKEPRGTSDGLLSKEPIGYFILEEGTRFAQYHKKSWFQRKMIERCFGLKRVDKQPTETKQPKTTE